MIIKILTVLFIFFTTSRAVLRFKDRNMSLQSLFFWMLLWAAILIFVFNPKLSDEIAHLAGIQRGTDIAFFASSIILFYLVFRLYIKIDSLDKDLTKLATNLSKKMHKEKTDKENA